MPEAMGFDIYSTLVNSIEMSRHLRPLVGDLADRFAQLWREKRLDYSIRRGLMRKYENLGVCTKQALLFAMCTLKVDLSDEDQERLIEELQNLRAFPAVAPGMEALKARDTDWSPFPTASRRRRESWSSGPASSATSRGW
jgi:2-haloacid dehalogenase